MGYPVKALQHGSLQSDPFSERRVNTGLGGQILLNALMLSYGGLNAMDFADSGIGLLLFAMGLFALARTLGLSRLRAAIVLCFIPVIPLFKVNLTTVYLSSASFLAVAVLLVHPAFGTGFDRRKTLLIGLLAGAACTTKSSNLCFLVPFIIFTAMLCAWMLHDRRILWRALQCLAIMPLVALPLSLAQRHNEGTLLFPLLGKGFHAGAYHHLPLPSGSGAMLGVIAAAWPNVLALMLGGWCVWQLSRSWSTNFRAMLGGFYGAAVLATCAMSISTSGEAVDRFTMPFYALCVFLLVLVLMHPADIASRRWRVAGYAVALVWLGFIANMVGMHEHQYQSMKNQLTVWLPRAHSTTQPEWYAHTSSESFAAEWLRAQHAQAAMPPGETAIETLVYCYPYDFVRNTIYIADYPGMASLPPGMPVDGTPEEVRGYLLTHSIHYLMLDRRLIALAPFTVAGYMPRTRHYGVHDLLRRLRESRAIEPWSVVEYNTSVHMRQQFAQLALTHKLVYDDGTVAVVQLND